MNKKDILGHAPILLMIEGFNNAISKEKISSKDFMDLTFKERVEMIKVRFEQGLIDCWEDYEERLKNNKHNEIEEELFKKMINISKAIEGACNKKKGKDTDNSVLFNCFLHNDTNPSMSWSAEQHGFYCFGCNKGNNKVFDIFDYLTKIQKSKDFKDAFKLAVSLMVQDGGTIKNPFFEKRIGKHTDYIPYTKEMNKVRHWDFLYPVENDLPALKKIEERGISLYTAKRMAVMTWYPTYDNIPYGLCYWVFINDDGTYSRRLATMNEAQFPKQFDEPFVWWNPKNKPMGIFNSRVLEHCRQFKEVCFVTESAIDAMSCEELGYHAVGLNSVNNLSKFFTEFVDKQPSTMLICLTDNDDAGRGAIVEFKKRKLYVADYEGWLGDFKDINEALIADRNNTLKALEDIEVEAKEYYGGIENE